MNSSEIKLATPADIDKIIPAFKELRPHRSEEDLRRLITIAFQEGYQIAYIGNETIAYSIIGFRILTFVFSGKTLKVDDLSTLTAHTKKGHAGKLLGWAIQYAKQENCEHFNLDSGFHRREAYKFYLNQGLFVESLHFGRKVIEL